MSRTRRGEKAPGYDYWTKRPGNKGGAPPGKFTKKMTHKAERKINMPAYEQTEHDYSDDRLGGDERLFGLQPVKLKDRVLNNEVEDVEFDMKYLTDPGARNV